MVRIANLRKISSILLCGQLRKPTCTCCDNELFRYSAGKSLSAARALDLTPDAGRWSAIKHPSHTRTSFSMPYLGRGHCLAVHWPQNTCPQLRQWCLRLVNVNSTRQRWHTLPSAQLGAVSAVNMASASLSSGNVCPLAFSMVIVSYKKREYLHIFCHNLKDFEIVCSSIPIVGSLYAALLYTTSFGLASWQSIVPAVSHLIYSWLCAV